MNIFGSYQCCIICLSSASDGTDMRNPDTDTQTIDIQDKNTQDEPVKKCIPLFLKIFGYTYWIYIAIVCILAGTVYYMQSVSPGILSTIYISDGTKTVQFEQMAHIASPEFYVDVKKSISTAANSGAVLYYE